MLLIVALATFILTSPTLDSHILSFYDVSMCLHVVSSCLHVDYMQFLAAYMWFLPAYMWFLPAYMWFLPAYMWFLPAYMWFMRRKSTKDNVQITNESGKDKVRRTNNSRLVPNFVIRHSYLVLCITSPAPTSPGSGTGKCCHSVIGFVDNNF
jgi:hypothetical protein